MNETVHISALTITVAGAVIGILLAVIAWLLQRFVAKFDDNFGQLTNAVAKLDDTMKRIDKDLSGRVVVLEERTKDSDQLYDRLRAVEQDVGTLKAAGCSVVNRCMQ